MIIKNNIALMLEKKDIIRGRVVIPEGVTHVGDDFAYGCTSLKKIKIY